MQIIRGKIPCAKKTVIYGPEGIGKSTFASQFPDPIFIDTEGSTKDMDVARLEAPSSWQMLLEEVCYIKDHPDICRTLVIDTADWAEMLCISHVCDKNHKSSVEEFGYGKGYVYVQEEFGRLLNLLEEVVGNGIHVVLTAHAKMRKFEQPDELGSYDRWEMKLSKNTAPIVKEWADMVLFSNYKTFVINVDGQGAQKGKNKAQGGKRVMYTTHHSCWDAKNRYGLPDEVPFDYSSIEHIFKGKDQPPVTEPPLQNEKREPVHQPEPEEISASKSSPEPAEKEEKTAPVDTKPESVKEETPPPNVDERIPKALRDLMIQNQVDEWDIQNVVAARGYYPPDMPIQNYDGDFISGVLVAAWDQVYAMVKEMKEKDSLVFN